MKELDFAALDALKRSQGDLQAGAGIETLEAYKEPLNGRLQREADIRRHEKERALAVAGEYQDNIRAAGELRAAIRRGLREGESIEILFLMAVKAVSHMTGDASFYTECEKGVKDRARE